MKYTLTLLTILAVFLVAGSLQAIISMDSLPSDQQKAFIGALQATQRGDKSSLDTILRNNPNFTNIGDRKDGNTVAHHAALRLHYEILGDLISKRADLTALNKHGQTVLDLVHFKLFDYIKNNADTQLVASFVGLFPQLITMQDTNGRTLLYMAAAWGRLSLIEALIRRGADINTLDRASSTPLHQAIVNKHRPVVNYLKNNGGIVYGKADVMVIPSQSYKTALAQAARTIFGSVSGAQLFDAQDLHMSLAYVSFPINYNENTDAYSKQAAAKLRAMFKVIFDRLGTSVSGVESFRMEGIGQRFGNNVHFTSLQTLGNVWAAVYTVPSHMLSFFENVTVAALRAYPDTRRTYAHPAPPHIAIARGANTYQGSENPLESAEFVGAIRTPVFPPEATLDELLKISIRIPSMNDRGYIEISKTWNELDAEYSAQGYAE